MQKINGFSVKNSINDTAILPTSFPPPSCLSLILSGSINICISDTPILNSINTPSNKYNASATELNLSANLFVLSNIDNSSSYTFATELYNPAIIPNANPSPANIYIIMPPVPSIISYFNFTK